MIKLEDKGRDYQRYSHSPSEKLYLANNFLQHVQSSNVSAFGTADEDLVIRFHNGSLYQYPGMADRYRDAVSSLSKGRWVWKHIRRAKVPYKKIGVLPLPDDIGITDEELFKEIDDRYIKDITRNLADVAIAQKLVFDENLARSFEMVTIGDIVFYRPL